MPDNNAKERAALRLVEILRVDEEKVVCPECGVRPGFRCRPSDWPGSHKARKEAARAELHSLLLTLGVGV